MSMLSQTSGAIECCVLLLTTLLAAECSTDPPLTLWDAATDEGKASRLPWFVLLILGVASGVVAVLHPLAFAAMIELS